MWEKDWAAWQKWRHAAARMASQRVFQANRLALYLHVPVADLTPAEGEAGPAPKESWEGGPWVPGVICRGSDVLAAVTAEGAERPKGLPERLLLLSLKEAAVSEEVEEVMEQTLSQLLGQRVLWRLSVRPVPQERIPELIRARMLDQGAETGGRVSWQPTEYGLACGLVEGCGPGGRGLPCCSERARERVEAQLARRPGAVPPWPEGRVPLRERLARAGRGLPSSEAASARAVLALGRTPLECHLAEFPEALNTIWQVLPMLRGQATYLDAAALIDLLFRPPQARPAALRDVEVGWERILTECLAQPFLYGEEKS